MTTMLLFSYLGVFTVCLGICFMISKRSGKYVESDQNFSALQEMFASGSRQLLSCQNKILVYIGMALLFLSSLFYVRYHMTDQYFIVLAFLFGCVSISWLNPMVNKVYQSSLYSLFHNPKKSDLIHHASLIAALQFFGTLVQFTLLLLICYGMIEFNVLGIRSELAGAFDLSQVKNGTLYIFYKELLQILLAFGVGMGINLLSRRLLIGYIVKPADVASHQIRSHGAKLPEDDIRNPFTILDQIGDRLQFFAAQLELSFIVVMGLILGLHTGIIRYFESEIRADHVLFVLAFLVCMGIGILLSLLVKVKESVALLNHLAIKAGVYVAISALLVLGLPYISSIPIGLSICFVIGLVSGYLIYYLSSMALFNAATQLSELTDSTQVTMSSFKIGIKQTLWVTIPVMLGLYVFHLLCHYEIFRHSSLEVQFSFGMGLLGLWFYLMLGNAIKLIGDSLLGHCHLVNENTRHRPDFLNFNLIGNILTNQSKQLAYLSLIAFLISWIILYIDTLKYWIHKAIATQRETPIIQHFLDTLHIPKSQVKQLVSQISTTDIVVGLNLTAVNPNFLIGTGIALLLILGVVYVSLHFCNASISSMLSDANLQLKQNEDIELGKELPDFLGYFKERASSIVYIALLIVIGLFGLIMGLQVLIQEDGIIALIIGLSFSSSVLAILISNSSTVCSNLKMMAFLQQKEESVAYKKIQKLGYQNLDAIATIFKDVIAPNLITFSLLFMLISILLSFVPFLGRV